MKVFKIVFVILLGCLISQCSLLVPILTITNLSGLDIVLVHWTDYIGDDTFFYKSDIWDSILNEWVAGLRHGESDTQTVSPGSSPIYFWFPDSITEYRTSAFISLSRGGVISFTFTGSTLIQSKGMSEIKALDTIHSLLSP